MCCFGRGGALYAGATHLPVYIMDWILLMVLGGLSALPSVMQFKSSLTSITATSRTHTHQPTHKMTHAGTLDAVRKSVPTRVCDLSGQTSHADRIVSVCEEMRFFLSLEALNLKKHQAW